MALLERVATLLRANLNDLVERAEDPEKLLKQVILDMENQLLQVKTQVAIAIADQHVLERKRREYEERVAEWTRRAELAVDKTQDDLARAALERSLGFRRMATSCEEQMEDQRAQVEHLKASLHKLQQKLEEARARSELLIAQHRRARALRKTTAMRGAAGSRSHGAAFRRMEDKVVRSAAVDAAMATLTEDGVDDRLAALEEQEVVERLLGEMKARRRRD
jgi:phage shock protein A